MIPTTIWGFVIIGGPILLGLALLYAVIRNRTQRNQVPKEVTERATRKLHEDLNRQDSRSGS